MGAGDPWGAPGLSPSPAPSGQLLASSSGVLNTKPKNYQLIHATDKETLFVFRLIGGPHGQQLSSGHVQACIVCVFECAHVCGSRGQAVHSEHTGLPRRWQKASLPQGRRTQGGRVQAKQQGLGNPYGQSTGVTTEARRTHRGERSRLFLPPQLPGGP